MEKLLFNEPHGLAEGTTARILLDPDNRGICYRTFFDNTWNENMAFREQAIQRALKSIGIPCIEEYEIDYSNHRIRMTDLSNGKRNLVASNIDLKYINVMGGELNAFYRQIVQQRPVYNADDFFSQLQAIVSTAQFNNILIKDNGFFLVVTPGGKMQTVIGDYGDGVIITNNALDLEKRQPLYLKNYILDVVCAFFPQLLPLAKQRFAEAMQHDFKSNF